MNNLGSNILDELDESIAKSNQDVQSIRESMNNFKPAEDKKRVHFESVVSVADETQEKTSSEEENKLDGLNKMLKEGGFEKLMKLQNDNIGFDLKNTFEDDFKRDPIPEIKNNASPLKHSDSDDEV